MKKTKKDIGRQIKKFRMLRGLTQSGLAEKVGLTEKQISKIETGVHYPMFENFIKILEILNVELKDFDCNLSVKSSTKLNSILKVIYNASEAELNSYYVIIKQIDRIYKENKKLKK